MCLLYLYVRSMSRSNNPRPKIGEYKAIIVNNRDEVYSRPTKPAHFWDDKILGGMDIKEHCKGGTWLAVSKEGKISCLLNMFQPANSLRSDRASRGFLVVDYLKSQQKGPQYMEEVKNSKKMYYPFNLVTLDPNRDSYDVNFYSSEAEIIHNIHPGSHGFGNCPLAKPFKKVQKGEKLFEDLVKTYGKKEYEEKLITELFAMMQNKELNFPDPQLSEQGEGHSENLVHKLSSICINIPVANIGTRTTTVILVDEGNQLTYREQTMQDPVNPGDPVWKKSHFSFNINPQAL